MKTYRLWDPVRRTIVISWDVSFNEPKSLKEREIAQAPKTNTIGETSTRREDKIVEESSYDEPGSWMEATISRYKEPTVDELEIAFQ